MASSPRQAVRAEQVGDGLGVDPVQLHRDAVVEAGVAQRLDDRHVGVGHVHVLAHDSDAHGATERLDPADERLPLRDVDGMRRFVDAQGAADVGVESLLVQDERDLVDRRGVDGRDHGVDGHVALQRDLALEALGDRLVAAADDHVGLNTPAAQLGHRVLGRLGLLLPRDQEGHQGQVDVADVVPADVPPELANGFDERDDLDVAHGAADLHDDDVHVLVGQAADAVLDFVGDVRDDLHGAAEEVAPPLLGDDRAVDAAGRRVRALRQVLVDEALVVAEVEVGLTTVFGDEHLAVLARVHRPGVHVDVGVEFAHRHPQAAALEEPAERGGGETLPERTRDAAGDEDELAHAAFGAPSITRDDRCTRPR